MIHYHMWICSSTLKRRGTNSTDCIGGGSSGEIQCLIELLGAVHGSGPGCPRIHAREEWAFLVWGLGGVVLSVFHQLFFLDFLMKLCYPVAYENDIDR